VSAKVKPVVLYNPIDTLRFNFKSKTDSKERLKIIYAGRLADGKNIRGWLEAAVFLLQKGIEATFELYGTGPKQAEVQQYIERSGFANKIIFKGYTEKIEDVYRNADLLLLLSERESFGNVVVESVLSGTPVITFDIPSMLEIFNEYPEFVIKKDEKFKESIYEKVKNIKELKTLALAAAVNFSKRFGSAMHMDKLEMIYEK
jgi:glycosyltransferase involved in cell wall biosynthesis